MKKEIEQLKFMLKDLSSSNFVGVEAIIKPDKIKNYLDKSYQEIMDILF